MGKQRCLSSPIVQERCRWRERERERVERSAISSVAYARAINQRGAVGHLSSREKPMRRRVTPAFEGRDGERMQRMHGEKEGKKRSLWGDEIKDKVIREEKVHLKSKSRIK